jgi:glycosyltransferase involved in cell wall biosynthesis
VRVSFVVPTLNQARFIGKCLDSCLGQAVDDREILVVDGLSSDGTQEILRGYGDRIRWVSEKDRGQSDALNKGVRMTSGEIIAWINSDDYYPDGNVLPRVLERFAADATLDVVYGDGVLVDVEHRPIRRLPAQPALDTRRLLLYRGLSVSQPSLFFRRALFVELGGVDEALHLTMDLDLWLRMFARARKVEYLPALLSCTTSHDAAKTVHAMWRQIDEIRRVKLSHARALGLSPVEQLRLWAGIASLYVYYGAVRVGLKRAV